MPAERPLAACLPHCFTASYGRQEEHREELKQLRAKETEEEGDRYAWCCSLLHLMLFQPACLPLPLPHTGASNCPCPSCHPPCRLRCQPPCHPSCSGPVAVNGASLPHSLLHLLTHTAIAIPLVCSALQRPHGCQRSQPAREPAGGAGHACGRRRLPNQARALRCASLPLCPVCACWAAGHCCWACLPPGTGRLPG